MKSPSQHSEVRPIKVVDLFCGTGGISYGLGAENEAFRTIAAIDLDTDACETARANHPDATVLEADITRISPSEFADATRAMAVDLVVGGPPCQGFTSLRPSRGTSLEDPRNRLYLEFRHYVEELRPKAFLFENVVGIVNASKGHLLTDLIAGFERVGYVVDWRIVNAANFGVPQKRERFILLGLRSDLASNGPIPFPRPTHSFEGRTIGIRDRSRFVVADSDLPPARSMWDAVSDLPSLGSGESSSEYAHPPLNPFQKEMRGDTDTLTLHHATNHNDKMKAVMALAGSSINALPEGMVTSGYSSCYSRLEADEPATTITVKFTSPASSKCIHPYDNRAITPREAARIQGFPDWFEFKGTRTSIASQIGNAVPPLLAARFADNIAEAIR